MYLLITFVFFIAIFVTLVLGKRRYPSVKKLPGPRPNFFVGNLIDFIGPTSEFLKTLEGYQNAYGRTLCIYEGPIRIVVATTEEKFVEYILSSTKLINKSDHYQYFYKWLGTGLLTSSGTKWKKRRRMLTPSFHFSILESFIDVFDSVGDIFIEKLNKHVNEDSFDIYPLVTLCTLDVICEATMGTSVNAQMDGDSEYVRSVKTMLAIITDRNFSPLDPKLFPLTLNFYREIRALKVLHTHTDKVIDERIKSKQLVEDNKGNEEFGLKHRLAFLDLLINAKIDGMPLSRTDIREEVDTFMFEGHDTTSSAISFAMYSLATNPEVQKKALEEQYQLFGDQKNPKVTMLDLQNMKYLELIIKETLRLYPSVPFFSRKVKEEFEFDGILYPRGLSLIVVPFLMQRHPTSFSDPEKFTPERFNDHNHSKHPYLYIPFSAGPRNCIGQKFAMLEMKSLISKVLRNFELLPAQPEQKLELAPEIILISKNGIKISLRRRDFYNNNK